MTKDSSDFIYPTVISCANYMARQMVKVLQPPLAARSFVLFVSPAVRINHVLAQIVSELLRDKCHVVLILMTSLTLLPISVFPL